MDNMRVEKFPTASGVPIFFCVYTISNGDELRSYEYIIDVSGQGDATDAAYLISCIMDGSAIRTGAYDGESWGRAVSYATVCEMVKLLEPQRGVNIMLRLRAAVESLATTHRAAIHTNTRVRLIHSPGT